MSDLGQESFVSINPANTLVRPDRITLGVPQELVELFKNKVKQFSPDKSQIVLQNLYELYRMISSNIRIKPHATNGRIISDDEIDRFLSANRDVRGITFLSGNSGFSIRIVQYIMDYVRGTNMGITEYKVVEKKVEATKGLAKRVTLLAKLQKLIRVAIGELSKKDIESVNLAIAILRTEIKSWADTGVKPENLKDMRPMSALIARFGRKTGDLIDELEEQAALEA